MHKCTKGAASNEFKERLLISYGNIFKNISQNFLGGGDFKCAVASSCIDKFRASSLRSKSLISLKFPLQLTKDSFYLSTVRCPFYIAIC